MLHCRRLAMSAGFVLLAVGCKSTKSADVKDDNGAAAAASASPDANKDFKCNTMAANWHEAINSKYGPTCASLVGQYPVLNSDTPVEEKRIICPFLRMINRTGRFDKNVADNMARTDADPKWIVPVTIKNIEPIVEDFGLSVPEDAFGSPAGVAAGQMGLDQATVVAAVDKYQVDIGRLPDAFGIAHNCGFNFELNDHQITDKARDASLAKIKAQATADGHVTFDALQTVKAQNCKRDYDLYALNPSQPVINQIDTKNQTLLPTKTDKAESFLLFMYLGGVENGYLMYDDIDRFFHGKMPANKSKYVVTKELALAAMAKIGKEKVISGFDAMFGR